MADVERGGERRKEKKMREGRERAKEVLSASWKPHSSMSLNSSITKGGSKASPGQP